MTDHTKTTQFPPDLIAVDPTSDEVCCDGGNGALGHPMVWYSFDGRDEVVCGYCDRRFVRSRAGIAAAH